MTAAVSPRGRRAAQWLVAAVLLVAAVAIFNDAAQLHMPATERGLGARAFPYLIAAGLVVLALLTLWESRRGLAPCDGVPDKWPVVLMVLGLLVQIVGLTYLGFTLATTLMFTCVAWAFGARPLWRAPVVGLVLSLVAYVVFQYGLQLNLPVGILERMW